MIKISFSIKSSPKSSTKLMQQTIVGCELHLNHVGCNGPCHSYIGTETFFCTLKHTNLIYLYKKLNGLDQISYCCGLPQLSTNFTLSVFLAHGDLEVNNVAKMRRYGGKLKNVTQTILT